MLAVVQLQQLRFAVTDVHGLDELKEKYDPFRAALEAVLETSIEFFPVDDLLMAASALQADQLDLVWAGPSEYVTIHARTQAVPLVSLFCSSKLPMKSWNPIVNRWSKKSCSARKNSRKKTITSSNW
ncbi:MAG: hypothetical protein Fur0046_26010 [Cyanobacteria bacterium J069]|nr:MAG: hypothetical protein D6742_16270 [Cyanobacteria bacterium J069]